MKELTINQCFAIVKWLAAASPKQKALIRKVLSMAGFKIIEESSLKVTLSQAAQWYFEKKEVVPPDVFDEITNTMSREPLLVLFLERKDKIPAWQALRAIMGFRDPKRAVNEPIDNTWCDLLNIPRQTLPLRGQGLMYHNWDELNNGLHGSSSLEELQGEASLLAEWSSSIANFLNTWTKQKFLLPPTDAQNAHLRT